jgi:putative DNA primase/helicase
MSLDDNDKAKLERIALERRRRESKDGNNDKIIELAKLDSLKFGKIRKEEAKKLGVPVKFLDDAVRGQQKEKKEQASFLPHWKNEPSPDSVAGDALLDELRAHLKRHVVLPPYADVALPLWILHSWVFEAFDITPYLAITSPTRRCGKSLLMTLLYWLCCRGKKNDSMSKAAIYRSVEAERPTLILDEVGWVLDLKDERQGILCGGFERLGYVEVCEGEGAEITVRRYSTYCPKAFGLIGRLTATLMDRSIEIPMRRKLAEKVERLRRRDNDDHARLRRLCCRWAQDNIEALAKAAPVLRAADFWEPLLAVAAQAGGEWVKLATEAALALSDGDSAGSEEKGVELLADIKTAFDGAGKAALTTKTLLADHLCADAERPWATWNKGKPISDRQLARLLKPFAILSETVHPYETGEAQDLKGYKREHFGDAFERYLTPAKGGQNDVSPGIVGSQASYRPNAGGMGITRDFSIRPESQKGGNEKCEKPANHGEKDARTDKNPETLHGSNGGNGATRFRSDVEDALEELRLRGEAVPEDDLTIPGFLDRRGEVCAQCGQPGGDLWNYDDLQVRLHPHCERPWVDARRNQPATAFARNSPLAIMASS